MALDAKKAVGAAAILIADKIRKAKDAKERELLVSQAGQLVGQLMVFAEKLNKTDTPRAEADRMLQVVKRLGEVLGEI